LIAVGFVAFGDVLDLARRRQIDVDEPRPPDLGGEMLVMIQDPVGQVDRLVDVGGDEKRLRRNTTSVRSSILLHSRFSVTTDINEAIYLADPDP